MERSNNLANCQLKVEMDYFTTLGIAFSCNYDSALRNTWIKIKIR